MKRLVAALMIAFGITFVAHAIAHAEYKRPVTYNTIGNYTYGSDGSTMSRIGNYTYGTDGDGNQFNCNTIGSYTYCN